MGSFPGLSCAAHPSVHINSDMTRAKSPVMITGFNDGHTDGHTAGYDEGLRSGKASGHAEGYQEGYNDGKSDGYDSGYQDGKNISRYSSTSASGETVTLTLSRTVDVTDTGSKYHRSGCSYLNRSKHPISLTDAQNQGYSPCLPSRSSPPYIPPRASARGGIFFQLAGRMAAAIAAAPCTTSR